MTEPGLTSDASETTRREETTLQNENPDMAVPTQVGTTEPSEGGLHIPPPGSPETSLPAEPPIPDRAEELHTDPEPHAGAAEALEGSVPVPGDVNAVEPGTETSHESLESLIIDDSVVLSQAVAAEPAVAVPSDSVGSDADAAVVDQVEPVPAADVSRAEIEASDSTVVVHPEEESAEGHQKGSRQKLFPKLLEEEMKEIWKELTLRKNSGQEIEIEVVATNRGGIVASYRGIEVFIPVSHWTLDRNTSGAIASVHPGDKVSAHVLEITAFETDARRVTATRRTLLRRELLTTIEPGTRITGRVVSILDFGVFVNIGGVDGLLPASEMSHDRVSRPSDLFLKGQEVEVVVKEVDRERKRVYLSRKELLPSPWEGVEDRFPTGSIQTGRVVGLGKDGAFVQLEPGVDGFLRAGELSWTRRVASPRDILRKGEDIQVRVLDVSSRRQRVSLSYRQAMPDPWPTLSETFGVGTAWEGEATSISNKGVVVAVGDVEGFLPRSRMGRESRRLPEMKLGEKLQVSVLEIDPGNHSLIFGLVMPEGEMGGSGEGRGEGRGGGRRGGDRGGRPDRRGDDRGRAPAVQPSNEIKSSETVTSFALGDLITDAIKARLNYAEATPEQETIMPAPETTIPEGVPDPGVGESSHSSHDDAGSQILVVSTGTAEGVDASHIVIDASPEEKTLASVEPDTSAADGEPGDGTAESPVAPTDPDEQSPV